VWVWELLTAISQTWPLSQKHQKSPASQSIPMRDGRHAPSPGEMLMPPADGVLALRLKRSNSPMVDCELDVWYPRAKYLRFALIPAWLEPNILVSGSYPARLSL
jgi:hypothetical protein